MSILDVVESAIIEKSADGTEVKPFVGYKFEPYEFPIACKFYGLTSNSRTRLAEKMFADLFARNPELLACLQAAKADYDKAEVEKSKTEKQDPKVAAVEKKLQAGKTPARD